MSTTQGSGSSTTQGSGGQQTGPWDVAIYMLQRFPIFALVLVLLGGGIYSTKILLEQKNEAEAELARAREASDLLWQKADERFRQALEIEKNAAER